MTRTLDSTAKWTILQRDEYRCAWCGVTTRSKLDVGHIVAVSRRGTDHPNNLAASCAQCNRDIGTRVLVPSKFCTGEIDRQGWHVWKRWGAWVIHFLPDADRDDRTGWPYVDSSCDISLTFEPIDYWIALDRVHEPDWHDRLRHKPWMSGVRYSDGTQDNVYREDNWSNFVVAIEFARTLIRKGRK